MDAPTVDDVVLEALSLDARMTEVVRVKLR
jgi:hypothetical protein